VSSTNDIERSPFRPFRALDNAPIPFSEWRDAGGIIADTLHSEIRLGLVTGPVGSGKSSFFATQARQIVREQGWAPFLISAGQVPDVSHLCLLLQRPDETAPSRSRGDRTQEAGDVENSRQVQIIQLQASSHTLDQGQDPQLGVLLAALAELDRPVCLLIDQAEQFLVEASPARGLLLSLLVATSAMPRVKVAVVFGVRDRYVGSLLAETSKTIRAIQNMAVIRGLTILDAVDYAATVLAGTSVRIARRRLDTLARSIGRDGLVWPVAWQAMMDEEFSRARAGRSTSRRPDPQEILARAVRARLSPLERSQADDAIVVLHQLARLSSASGPQDVRSIAAATLGLSEVDVRLALAHLETLGLVREIRSGRFAPAHDSLLGAVSLLRGASEEDAFQVEMVDRAVSFWLNQGEVPAATALIHLHDRLVSGNIPSPYFACVSAVNFDLFYGNDSRTLGRLRDVGDSIEVDAVSRILYSRAARLGRPGHLKPSEIFTLLITQGRAGGGAALKAISQIAPDSGYSDMTHVIRAIVDSANGHLLELLSNEHDEYPAHTWDIVLQAAAVQGLQPTDALARRLWEMRAEGLVAGILRLLREDPADWLTADLEEFARDRDAEVAALAVGILARTRHEGWRAHFVDALHSENVDLRRRLVLALPAVASEFGAEEIIGWLGHEVSPLVREAFTRASIDLVPSQREPLLRLALGDSAEIVREGAVYALRTALPERTALELLELVERDSSSMVRDAILQVLTHYGIAPSHEFLEREKRLGEGPMRVFAIKFLDRQRPDEAAMAVGEVLAAPDATRELQLAALAAAGVLRHESLIGPIRSLVTEVGDIEILSSAIDALEALRSPAAVDVIAGLAGHRNAQVRERSVYALVRLGGRAAADAVAARLFDPEPSVQSPAIYGLARLGVRDYVPHVRRLQIRSEGVRRAVNYYTRVGPS
jgi:HEAT repeat protein